MLLGFYKTVKAIYNLTCEFKAIQENRRMAQNIELNSFSEGLLDQEEIGDIHETPLIVSHDKAVQTSELISTQNEIGDIHENPLVVSLDKAVQTSPELVSVLETY